MHHSLTVGEGAFAREIAADFRDGRGPTTVWLGGFRSDMTGTKAEALDTWASGEGRAFLRFDYSGHGASGGRFEDGTITRWLEESEAVVDRLAGERPILVGSSMGGWIALLLARAMRSRDPGAGPSGLVLIAPAADFTQELMWPALSEEARATLVRDGIYLRPSAYSDDPYPITRALIEDGHRHCLLGGTIETGCQVHILQGMQDPDVPWEHAMRLVEHLPADSVQLTLVKDGDHRLSRPEDLDRLVTAVAASVRSAEATAGSRQLRLTV